MGTRTRWLVAILLAVLGSCGMGGRFAWAAPCCTLTVDGRVNEAAQGPCNVCNGQLATTTTTVTTSSTTTSTTSTTTTTTTTTKTTTSSTSSTTTTSSTTATVTTSTSLPVASTWARAYGAEAYDSGVGVVDDAAGNAVLVGQMRGTTTAGLADGLIVKATPAGATAWIRLLGGTADDAATGVAIDGPGDVYVSMRFGATFTAADTLTASGSGDAALVKLHGADGIPLWARGWGGTSEDRADAVAVDPVSGNVYVTGFFQSSALGLTANAALDVYLAKYTPAGTLVWAKNFPNTGNDRGYAVTVSPDGTRVALAGWFSNGINFTGGATSGCGTTTPACLWSANGLSNGFVAVFTSDGAPVWSRSIGAPAGEDAAYTVVFDRVNDLCAGGYAYQAVDFGGGVLPVLGNADGWIACYDPTGAYLASRRVGGGGNDFVNGLAYDPVVNALVAVGTSDAAADWGDGARPTLGNKDAVLAKYAMPMLTPVVWVRRQGGTGIDDAQKVTIAPNGDVLVAGYFYATATFAGQTITAAGTSGASDAFLARFAP